jgi:hypothetical protein
MPHRRQSKLARGKVFCRFSGLFFRYQKVKITFPSAGGLPFVNKVQYFGDVPPAQLLLCKRYFRANHRSPSTFRSMFLPFAGFLPATPIPAAGVQSGKSFELTAHYCSFCRKQVLHTVLEKMGAREHISAGLASVLLQCNACEAFALR